MYSKPILKRKAILLMAWFLFVMSMINIINLALKYFAMGVASWGDTICGIFVATCLYLWWEAITWKPKIFFMGDFHMGDLSHPVRSKR